MAVPAISAPTYTAQVYNAATIAWETIPGAAIKNIRGATQTSGNDANGLAFGLASSPSLSFEVATSDLVGMSFNWSANWYRAKVRVLFGYVGAAQTKCFEGLLVSRTRGFPITSFELRGYDLFLEELKLHTSASYRRPIATKTTATSIENPLYPGYGAGSINYAFWMAGGRPYAQATSYPSAAFYYDCDFGAFAPEFSWFSGESALEECLRLVQSAGGQIYQGSDGILRYVNPLALAVAGGETFTYTKAHYQPWPTEKARTGEQVGTITCDYTSRYVAAMQEVHQDTTFRVIAAGAYEDVTFDIEVPVWSYIFTGGSWRTQDIVARYFDGRAASPSVMVLEAYAQRVTLRITNTSDLPIGVSLVTIMGQPLAAGGSGSVSFGSGAPERKLPDLVQVQSKEHAEQLVHMVHDFYSPLLPIITLETYFDGNRYVGEHVLLAYTELGFSAAPCRIVAIRHDRTGTRASVDLVVTTGMPALSELFLVGTINYTEQSKKLGY